MSRKPLVTIFDELVGDFNLLKRGTEPEFLTFVRSTEELHREWRRLLAFTHELQAQLASVREERATLEAQLEHARNELEKQIRKYKRTQQERETFEQQIRSIRDFLNENDNASRFLDEHERERLAFITSGLSSSLLRTDSTLTQRTLFNNTSTAQLGATTNGNATAYSSHKSPERRASHFGANPIASTSAGRLPEDAEAKKERRSRRSRARMSNFNVRRKEASAGELLSDAEFSFDMDEANDEDAPEEDELMALRNGKQLKRRSSVPTRSRLEAIIAADAGANEDATAHSTAESQVDANVPEEPKRRRTRSQNRDAIPQPQSTDNNDAKMNRPTTVPRLYPSISDLADAVAAAPAPKENVKPTIVSTAILATPPVTRGRAANFNDLVKHQNSASRIKRDHLFLSKTVLRYEVCTVCTKRLTFGRIALKCEHCRVMMHTSCRAQCSVPCIPMHAPVAAAGTATAGQPVSVGRRLAKISEYAPAERPCVPAIVVHCINEVESRGLTEPGLYRVSGSQREVRALFDTFMKGKLAVMYDKDISVVSSTLKLFLNEVREPLVTFAKWPEFVALANEWHEAEASRLASAPTGASLARHQQLRVELEQRLRVLVASLPRAYRDTLAFLCLHLLKVEQAESATLMNRHALATVFGPALVGNSVPEPPITQSMTEQPFQVRVVEFLLEFDDAFWSVYVAESDSEMDHVTRSANAAIVTRSIAQNTNRRGDPVLTSFKSATLRR